MTTTTNSEAVEPKGLVYPSGFLSSLPILLSRPAPFAPIRALTAAQFAEIVQLHVLADEDRLGDSVLFPFLHGIEGNNLSQNTFFANAARSSIPTYTHPLLPPINPAAKLPAFRGLVWVRADENDGVTTNGHGNLNMANEQYDEDYDMEDSDNELSDQNDHIMHDENSPADANVRPPIAITIPSRVARSASISTGTSISSSEQALSTSTAPTSLPPSPSSVQCGSTPFSTAQSHILTSTLRTQDLLVTCPEGPCFAPPRVPDGISLRNFGIQVPIYATLSDVVIYAPKGMTRSAFAVAERFKHAIEAKARERERTGKGDIVHYNVFVITDPFSEIETKYPHLVAWDSNGKAANYVDFAIREREEMCNLTRATEVCDGLWLGNSNDVPFYEHGLLGSDPFAAASQNNPSGFDICVECCDGAQFPSAAELACAEGHIRRLDELWALRWQNEHRSETDAQEPPPPRPAPSANHVLHLAFPSSPMANQYSLNHVLSFVSFLQSLMYPEPPRTTPTTTSPTSSAAASLASIFSPSPIPFGSLGSISGNSSLSNGSTHRRNNSSGSSIVNSPRRCRVLLFSSDGYTETSILALCLLMAPKPPHYTPAQHSALSVFANSTNGTPRLHLIEPQESTHRSESVPIPHSHATGSSTTHGMSLPEAYLELQIARGRSFYVYPSDLDLLKRAEARLYTGARDVPKERGRDREILARTTSVDGTDANGQPGNGFSKWKWSTWGSRASSFSIPSAPPEDEELHSSTPPGIASALIPMLSSSTPNASSLNGKQASTVPRRRARASTSPMPHILADHWAWFSDPRFDGSFPSRVLPFLYLGNLAHASNAYMLHALGITHVVSVGECALVPPQSNPSQAAEYRFSYGGKVLGAGPGSLWLEEREGRIKVLDIKGVSDDGIDSLRPRFREVCDWIDAARQEGGKVLIHCRVGVSRSATVTIAYVMKHLGIPLVDAYLLVRSRRLSVLIQPNLRLLYNLCSWEVELAREQTETNPEAIKAYMSRRLSWPYLAREVHLLNEKYIQ